ncbi:MAG: polymer-forming cytoskeletal protein [Proteobacteria bacterium]|nr:polymer-forming cytoskeletal protein [Pseudomonadota bacterium]
MKKSGNMNSFLGKGVEFEGKLNFSGTINISGHFKGDISATEGTLIVDEEGMIEATIHVPFLVNKGEIRGNIIADQKIELCASGKVFGDIQAPIIMMQEGAIFKGSCGTHDAKEISAPVIDFEHALQTKEHTILRLGPNPPDMREMREDDILLSRLKLLIIMSKAYLEDYPIGKYRKEAIIGNAEQVAKEYTRLSSHIDNGKTKKKMDSDHVFYERIQLLAVMAKAFAEDHPMGHFRKKALKENVDHISRAITFTSRIGDMKFLKVA